MTKLIYYKSFFIIPLLSLIAACQATENWTGDYLYEAEFGENYAKTPVIVDYELVIDATKCQFDIVGYQVNESILCTSKQEGDDLTIKFQSYSNGKVRNIYGVQRYKIGSTLFSLKMEGHELITTWQALLPDKKMDKSGKYFKKLDK